MYAKKFLGDLAIFGRGVAYILYYFIVDRLGAITASSATYIPPVVALAIGWLLVGEQLGILDGAAVLLILAGVMVLRSGLGRPPRVLTALATSSFCETASGKSPDE